MQIPLLRLQCGMFVNYDRFNPILNRQLMFCANPAGVNSYDWGKSGY